MMFLRTFVAVAFLCGGLFAAQPASYFEEDGGTGAMYSALTSDGNYKVTAREHMGVWVEESGRWAKSDARIAFTPDKAGKSPSRALEVVHRGHAFLSWEDDLGPSIVVPTEETERNLDQNPKALPPYVFFEISPTVYQRETARTYPFRTLPRYRTDIPQLIPEKIKVANAPRTARYVRCFGSFTSNSTIVDVVRKCGIPDEHQGSGIYIFLYGMHDGSAVAVGTADLNKLLYVNHIETGKSSSLLLKAQTKEEPAR